MLSSLFRSASRLRGARIFHPRGTTFTATWEPDPRTLPGSTLTSHPRRALVRISRGVGLPVGVPDVLGVAVKVLDVHGPAHDQDLLLASSGGGRITRHLLRFTRDLAAGPLSTLLPYDVAGVGRRTITGRAVPGTGPTRYAEVVGVAAPAFEIRLGGPDGQLLATVRPAAPAAAEVGEAARFDPWHTGPELRPVGWLNRIRRPTYTASQDGRGAPSTGHRAVDGRSA